jgi:hypothetical protein
MLIDFSFYHVPVFGWRKRWKNLVRPDESRDAIGNSEDSSFFEKFARWVRFGSGSFVRDCSRLLRSFTEFAFDYVMTQLNWWMIIVDLWFLFMDVLRLLFFLFGYFWIEICHIFYLLKSLINRLLAGVDILLYL